MRSLLLALVLAAPTAFAAEWKTLDTDDFSVSLPGAANKKEMIEQSQAGAVKVTVWGVQTPNAFFAVSIADYPTGIDGDVLGRVRDGAMASVQAKIGKDFPVVLTSTHPKRKYTGREFDADTQTGVKLAARLFLVEKRLYQMICVSPSNTFSAADFKQFADSFKLKPIKTATK